MSTRLGNPALHGRLIQAGAVFEIASSIFLICGPVLIPDYPLLPAILGIPVPLAYQRSLAVVIGAVLLIEGVLLLTLARVGWWVGIFLGMLLILHGLVSGKQLLFTLFDIGIVFYLYYTREIFA